MEDKNFMSLYDFLGHAAGTELGKEVAVEAKKQGQKFIMKELKNKAYTGKVMMYDEAFLTKYFTKTQEPSVKTPNEDYELPF